MSKYLIMLFITDVSFERMIYLKLVSLFPKSKLMFIVQEHITPLSHKNATNFIASKITIHPLKSKARHQPKVLYRSIYY